MIEIFFILFSCTLQKSSPISHTCGSSSISFQSHSFLYLPSPLEWKGYRESIGCYGQELDFQGAPQDGEGRLHCAQQSLWFHQHQFQEPKQTKNEAISVLNCHDEIIE